MPSCRKSKSRSKSPKRKLYITKSGKSRCAKGSHRRVRRSGSKGSKCVRSRKAKKSRSPRRKSKKSGRKSRKSSPGRKSRKSRRSSSKSKKRGFRMVSHGSVKRFGMNVEDAKRDYAGAFGDTPDPQGPNMPTLQDYLDLQSKVKIQQAQAQVSATVDKKIEQLKKKKITNTEQAKVLIDKIEKCVADEGKIFNMGSLRCKSIALRQLKACGGDRPDRNPRTNRCYDKSKYDERMSKLGARKSRKSRKSKSRKACKSGQRRSRKTGRCRVSPKRKACKSGSHRSRKTNRCRKSKK